MEHLKEHAEPLAERPVQTGFVGLADRQLFGNLKEGADHQMSADLTGSSNYFYFSNSTCKVLSGVSETSQLQIQNIIDSTKTLLDSFDSIKHVSTYAERSALKLLKRFGSVFIKGRSGTGKTRSGIKILSEIAKVGKRKPIILSFAHEWCLLPKTGQRYVVMVDDIFGSSNLVQSQVDEWTRVLDIMWSSVESGHIFLVITSRPEISDQCEFKTKKYRLMKTMQCITLDEGEFTFTVNEKISMLRKYRVTRKIACENDIKRIANMTTVLGFPQVCEFFVNNKQAQTMGVRFFQNPYACLIDSVQCLRENDPLGYFVLILILMSKGVIEHTTLKPFQSSAEFAHLVSELSKGFNLSSPPAFGEIKTKADFLTSGYLQITGKGYHFKHQSIFDAVFLCMSRENPEIAIMACPAEMLVEFVRTGECETKYHTAVKLTLDQYEVLTRRITELLLAENSTVILDHPSLNEEEFAACIVRLWNGDSTQNVFKEIITSKIPDPVPVLYQSNNARGTENHVVFRFKNKLAYLVFKKQCVARYIISSENVDAISLSTEVLACAILTGQNDIVQSLMDMGLKTDEDCFRALCASRNLEQIITDRILCQLKIEWEKLVDGKNMLCLATVNGKIQAAESLLRSITKEKDSVVFECFEMVCTELRYNQKYCSRDLDDDQLFRIKHILQMILGLLSDGIKPDREERLIETCAGHAYPIALKCLLEKGLSISTSLSNDLHSLNVAMKYGSFECVKILLNHVPDHLTKDLSSLLIEYISDASSSRLDSCTKIELLLQFVPLGQESDVKKHLNVPNSDGETPLIVASKNGNTELLVFLINKGADVNAEGKWGETALSAAVRNSHIHCLETLLREGAKTAEVYKDDVDIMKCLLTKRCEMKMSIWENMVVEAICANDFEMIDILYSQHLSVYYDVSPLDFQSFNMSLWYGGLDMVKHVATKQSYRKSSSLHYAAKSDIEPMDKLKYLLEDLHVSVKTKDKYGRSAMFPAVQTGNLEVVEYLIEKGLDLKERDLQGYTLLHAVCHSKRMSFSMVKMLLDAGVDPDVCGAKNDTALHVALNNWGSGKQNVFSLLIEKTRNVDQEDASGATPLDLAIGYDLSKCVVLLKQNGAKKHSESVSSFL